FATAPVALDHVGWDILDTKRAEEGWQPVAQMGVLQQPPGVALSARLAALAAHDPAQALTLSAAGRHWPGNQDTEAFDRRQPEHVILAGTIGLGVFDARGIEHRVVRWDPGPQGWGAGRASLARVGRTIVPWRVSSVRSPSPARSLRP